MLLILIVFELNTFQKKYKNLLVLKTFKKNIFRIQAYDSIICGYFFIGFIDFMLARKPLTDFSNLFSSSNFKKMMI